MYFTDGKRQAFEKLMTGKPGFDHYDTGVDGDYPEWVNSYGLLRLS